VQFLTRVLSGAQTIAYLQLFRPRVGTDKKGFFVSSAAICNVHINDIKKSGDKQPFCRRF